MPLGSAVHRSNRRLLAPVVGTDPSQPPFTRQPYANHFGPAQGWVNIPGKLLRVHTALLGDSFGSELLPSMPCRRFGGYRHSKPVSACLRGAHGCFSTPRSRSGRFASLPIAAVKWTCLRGAHPDSAPDDPLLPAPAFFTEYLERIDAWDSLRPAELAVPQTSWNHLQYAPDGGMSQRISMTER